MLNKMSSNRYRTVLILCVVLVNGLILEGVDGKIFTRCQLAKELLRQGFQRTFITNWVCLIESESDRDTGKLVNKSNGSNNYGLFQINSKKYCKEGKKGGTCNVQCENLLNDDITTAASCANKIFESEGFKAWSGWMRKCKGSSNLPDISNCPGLDTASRNSPEAERFRKNSFGSPGSAISVG